MSAPEPKPPSLAMRIARGVVGAVMIFGCGFVLGGAIWMSGARGNFSGFDLGRMFERQQRPFTFSGPGALVVGFVIAYSGRGGTARLGLGAGLIAIAAAIFAHTRPRSAETESLMAFAVSGVLAIVAAVMMAQWSNDDGAAPGARRAS